MEQGTTPEQSSSEAPGNVAEGDRKPPDPDSASVSAVSASLLSAGGLPAAVEQTPPVVINYVQHVHGGAGAQGASVEQRVGASESTRANDRSLLSHYLSVARRAALDRPYAGVLPGVTPPPMAKVYLYQVIRPLGLAAARYHADLDAIPTDALLTGGGNYVIIGGPGVGKSSLLRTCVSTLAANQLVVAGDVVPVLIPAVELVGDAPLPTLLAQRVSALLKGGGLRKELPADFFRTQPAPGVGWLLLVDGLDEIADPEARRLVMRELGALADDATEPGYRFVLTTRPLPDSELSVLKSSVGRLEIQPFSTDDVRSFAETWFKNLGLHQPKEYAKSFGSALRNNGLTELARIPLVSTMLCQLFADDPGRELPTSRTQIYSRFVDLLHQRQAGRGSGALDTQTRAAWQGQGSAAMAAVQTVLMQIDELIGYLASGRLRGAEGDAVDILTTHPAAAVPKGVPRDMWISLLKDTLRRSGLVIERINDFDFWHPTLLEFLAARYDTADEDTCKLLHVKLFGQYQRKALWGRRSWVPPEAEMSYIAFVVGVSMHHEESLLHALVQLAKHGGLEGAALLTRLALYGEPLPEPVTDALTAQLDRATDTRRLSSYGRAAAASMLAQLGILRGLDRLRKLAVDSGIPPFIRFLITAELLSRSHNDGLSACRRLATESHGHTIVQGLAARVLSSLNDPVGAVVLERLANAEDADAYDQIHAAMAKVKQGDEYAVSDLRSIFTNKKEDLLVRVRAASALTELGNPGYAGFLDKVTKDDTATYAARGAAASVLYELGDNSMADFLADIASNQTAPIHERMFAADRLKELGDQRGSDLNVTLNNAQENNPGVAATIWRLLLGDDNAAEAAALQRFLS